MKLSIVIPCFNEENTIETVVERVRKYSFSNHEIIIVDDCSTDGTRKKLEQTVKNKVDKIVYHKANSGKGAAIKTALKMVTGDIVIIQDADLEYDPKEHTKIIQPILDDKADVVYGSRFITSSERRVLYFWHSLGNKFLTLLSNIFTNLNLSDMETCYKAFRTDIIKNMKLKENRFGFEPEITAKIARLECRVFEIGISYNGRTYQEGKKISWKDGVRAIYCIVKYSLFSK